MDRGKTRYRDKIRAAYRRLKKAYGELRDSHVEMIFRLAMMAEFRDPFTGTHLVRIADYSAMIAQSLGLPKKEVELIRYASPMHDVGKIVLPDSILKKKGKLTAEEVVLVRKHPDAGGRIFMNSQSRLLQTCGVIAYSHHEWFDGAGYPKGLKGDKIPLYGRIVSVADCFDALTSKRSYKSAFGFEESVSIIMEEAGTHFDPAVVMAFMKSKDKIKKTWEANRDIEQFISDMGIRDDTFLS